MNLPTRREHLAVAASQIRTWENPLGSNRTKFGVAYGWNGVAWCQIFDWWVAKTSGLPHLKTASTMAAVADARKNGTWHDGIAGIAPGDSVYFHWPESSRAKNQPDHVETCEIVLGPSDLQTIGGNVSSGVRRLRRRANFLGYIRHIFAPDAPTFAPESVHRFWNPGIHDHFYTASPDEARRTAATPGWRYEGVAWANDQDNTVPVWRFRHRRTGQHFYTTSRIEYAAVQKAGWVFEQVAFFAGGTTPVRRFYNRLTGEHLFTANPAERPRLWRDEGIGFSV